MTAARNPMNSDSHAEFPGSSRRTAPMDIAFLLGYPEISGGTNVIMEHAIGLTALGHRVSIVTELGFDRQRLSWKPAAMDLPLLSHAECRKRPPFDLVLATWWRSVYDLPYVPAKRVGYFVQSIESRFFPHDQPDMKSLAEYTYRIPMPIVTEASWIKRHLEGVYGRRCGLVLNGIDKSTFNLTGPVTEPRPTSHMRVLIEGPLNVPFKRIELALDLCRRAGVKDLWLLTSSACESMPGVSRVFSRVPVTRVGDIYRSCDVLVKLSTVEGMFGPPLEMFHCGGTTIATDVTGHEEYLQHGVNGIIVKRGHEAQVVDYLHALEQDRPFLEYLKRGAVACAGKWPTWETSVRGMEAWCRSIIDEPVLEETLTHDAMLSLRGALRLAKPLHDAAMTDLSGKQMLRRAAKKAEQKLRARVGERIGSKLKLRPAPVEAGPGGVPIEVKPVPPGPKLDRLLAFASGDFKGSTQTPIHACFIGPASCEAFVPRGDGLVRATFIPVRPGARQTDFASGAAVISACRPDVVFIFDADRADDCVFEMLRDKVVPVVGHARGVLTTERTARLARRFPLVTAGTGVSPVLAHLDSNAIATLRDAGVACIGPLLLPIDSRGWMMRAGEEASFAAWRARRIEITMLGRENTLSASYIRALRSLPGSASRIVHFDGSEDPASLRGVLGESKLVVHLPEGGDDPIASAEVVRSLALGCIAAAPRLRVDYGMLPDEHYIYYRDPADLLKSLGRAMDPPDEMDVVRRTGWTRASEFEAHAWYARFFRERVLNAPPRPTTAIEAKSSTTAGTHAAHAAHEPENATVGA